MEYLTTDPKLSFLSNTIFEIAPILPRRFNLIRSHKCLYLSVFRSAAVLLRSSAPESRVSTYDFSSRYVPYPALFFFVDSPQLTSRNEKEEKLRNTKNLSRLVNEYKVGSREAMVIASFFQAQDQKYLTMTTPNVQLDIVQPRSLTLLAARGGYSWSSHTAGQHHPSTSTKRVSLVAPIKHG